jgi:hypothetical protein
MCSFVLPLMTTGEYSCCCRSFTRISYPDTNQGSLSHSCALSVRFLYRGFSKLPTHTHAHTIHTQISTAIPKVDASGGYIHDKLSQGISYLNAPLDKYGLSYIIGSRVMGVCSTALLYGLITSGF